MDFNLIHKIFIADGGWLTLLEGVGVTLKISFLSLLFGTIFGAVVCYFRVCENRIPRYFAACYIELLRGSPVLMLLMLLFYGVFARSGLSPLTVAIIAFSAHTASHVAEILRSALKAVDYGQVEAARTLGFSKIEAFRFIMLPQIVKFSRPVYQSTVINLIQWTSVVGYISITDLTRVIYNTASRTMEPFITISGGMIIYIAIAYAVYGIFYVTDKKNSKGNL